MALTDSAIRALKPRDAAHKVADEKGLYLMVTPAGGLLWKLKFRNRMGIEKKLSLGAYPDVSLKSAREARDTAQSTLRTRSTLSQSSISRRTAAMAWPMLPSTCPTGSGAVHFDTVKGGEEEFRTILKNDVLKRDTLDNDMPKEAKAMVKKAAATLGRVQKPCQQP